MMCSPHKVRTGKYVGSHVEGLRFMCTQWELVSLASLRHQVIVEPPTTVECPSKVSSSLRCWYICSDLRIVCVWEEN